MSQKVNLKTIANDLNLSPGTVSRILNGKARQFRISDETVALVQRYVKEKNYQPNLLARGLQASKTFTLGLMIPDISNPFFALMARHIENAASLANYSILLVDAEEDINKEMLQLRNMKSRNVDGIIAAPVGTNYQHFAEINQAGIPLVFVDRYFSNLDIPFITLR
jgi:LacI family transcriptional regulator